MHDSKADKTQQYSTANMTVVISYCSLCTAACSGADNSRQIHYPWLAEWVNSHYDHCILVYKVLGA